MPLGWSGNWFDRANASSVQKIIKKNLGSLGRHLYILRAHRACALQANPFKFSPRGAARRRLGEATRTARVARSSRPAPEKKASERGGVIGGGRMWAGGHGAALLPAGPAQHPPSPAPPPQAGTHHAPARFPSRPSVHPSVEQAELRNPN